MSFRINSASAVFSPNSIAVVFVITPPEMLIDWTSLIDFRMSSIGYCEVSSSELIRTHSSIHIVVRLKYSLPFRCSSNRLRVPKWFAIVSSSSGPNDDVKFLKVSLGVFGKKINAAAKFAKVGSSKMLSIISSCFKKSRLFKYFFKIFISCMFLKE